MKLTYLGTAAAEGWPALYCSCPSCVSSREKGGKSIRTRSQSLLNDDLLIDFPADTYHHVLTQGIDLDKVRDVLITHSHEDHFYMADLANRQEGYIPKNARPDFVLNLYGNEAVAQGYRDCLAIPYNASLPQVVAMHEIFPFEEVRVGSYRVYPMPANHEQRERSYFYIIVDGEGKTLLYAHDTGYLKDECWEFMKKFKFDLVSLDCTCGKLESRDGHMGLSWNIKVKERMETEGMTKRETMFIINHFSHNCKFLNHGEIEAAAAPYGFRVSYDGMAAEV